MAMSGYVLPAGGSEQIELHVRCLNGEGCMLSLDDSTLGREVHRLVSQQLPSKRGSRLVLHHLASPLFLHKTLQEQEIAGKAATLSCTYVPTSLCAAWSYVKGFPISEEEFALEGVTQIVGTITTESLCRLPESLDILTFGDDFNPSLDQVTFPSSLQSLTFGVDFNQSLDRVTFPSSLQSLTFRHRFNQSLDRVTFPSSLQSLTLSVDFNQSLYQVTFPSSLQSLDFGHEFNQSLDQVTFPRSLQSLTFRHQFNQSLDK